jgi:hypothetical protein
MVRNCTWLVQIKIVIFLYNLQNKWWYHIHKILDWTFNFKQINNRFCCVKTTKQLSFIEHILCPKFNLLAHCSTSLVNIFHLLINLKKPRFRHWFPNRKLTIVLSATSCLKGILTWIRKEDVKITTSKLEWKLEWSTKGGIKEGTKIKTSLQGSIAHAN